MEVVHLDALVQAALEDVGTAIVLALHFLHGEGEDLLDEIHALSILVFWEGNHRNLIRTSKVLWQ